jgi:hypothetical protein
MKTRALILPCLLAAVVSMTGCGKKEEAPPVQPAAAPQETPPPVAQAPAAPSQPAIYQEVNNPNEALKTAQTAMKSQDYEAAAANLIVVQRSKQITADQAAAARQRMVELQAALAQAQASGDPKAKAAAEMLRRSAMR